MSSSHVISIRSAPLTLKLLKTSSCDGVSPATSDKNSNAVSASHVFTSLCVVIGTVEGISCLVLTYNMSTINTPVAHANSFISFIKGRRSREADGGLRFCSCSKMFNLVWAIRSSLSRSLCRYKGQKRNAYIALSTLRLYIIPRIRPQVLLSTLYITMMHVYTVILEHNQLTEHTYRMHECAPSRAPSRAPSQAPARAPSRAPSRT